MATLDAVAAEAASPPLNVTSLSLELTRAGGEVAAANASALAASLSQLAALQTDPALPSALRLLQAQLAQPAAAAATAAFAALDIYSGTLRCATSNVACIADGSTAGPCDGFHPCEGGSATCAADFTVQCSSAADCNAGDVCPFDAATFDAAATLLSALSAAEPAAAAAAAAAGLTALLADVAAAPSAASLAASVSSLEAALAGLPVASYLTSVEIVQLDLSPSALGLDAPASIVREALDGLGGLDLSDVRAQVRSFGEVVDNAVTTAAPLIAQASAAVAGVIHVLDVGIPAAQAALARPRLEARYSSGGLSGLVSSVAGAVDGLLASAANASKAAGVGTALLPNVTALVAAFLPTVSALDDDALAASGPISFAAGVAQLALVVPARETGDGDSVFAAANGSAWSGGRVCLTRACLNNEIDDLNGKPLAVAGLVLPLSREQLMLALFVFPALPALLALLALLAYWPCGCGQARTGANAKAGSSACCCADGGGIKWLLSCSACMSCGLAPVLFLFAGAVSFTLVLVLADACRGVPNVGAAFVAGSAGGLCGLAGGSFGAVAGEGVCRITLPTLGAAGAAPPLVVDVAIADVYAALLGQQCELHGAALDGIFGDLAAAARALPTRAANATLAELAAPGGLVQLRAPLLGATELLVAAVGASAGDFVEGLAGVAGCEALSGDLGAVLDSVCCSLAEALWSWVTAWYLLACALVLLWGASLCAYKRLPPLWGPEKEALAAGAPEWAKPPAKSPARSPAPQQRQLRAYAGGTLDAVDSAVFSPALSSVHSVTGGASSAGPASPAGGGRLGAGGSSFASAAENPHPSPVLRRPGGSRGTHARSRTPTRGAAAAEEKHA